MSTTTRAAFSGTVVAIVFTPSLRRNGFLADLEPAQDLVDGQDVAEELKKIVERRSMRFGVDPALQSDTMTVRKLSIIASCADV